MKRGKVGPEWRVKKDEEEERLGEVRVWDEEEVKMKRGVDKR